MFGFPVSCSVGQGWDHVVLCQRQKVRETETPYKTLLILQVVFSAGCTIIDQKREEKVNTSYQERRMRKRQMCDNYSVDTTWALV